MEDILLEHIDLKKDDFDLVGEEPVSEEELKELQEVVLNAIRLEQECIGKEKIRFTAKAKKIKKWLLPLAASLIISSAVIASTVTIGQIFKDYFGEESPSIGESGKVIGKTTLNQGIRLNIQGVVGDDKTAIVIFDLTKEDGTTFAGNSLDFGELDFIVAGKSVSASSYIIGNDNKSMAKRTFRLRPLLFNEMPENFVGSDATMHITDIIEIEEGDWESEVSLADYLEQHPECLSQKTIEIPEEFLEHAETREVLIDSGYNESDINEFLSKKPKYGIDSKNLGLALYDGNQKEWTINNIGFIDGQMHIRMSGNTIYDYIPKFKDAAGNEIKRIWSSSRMISKGIREAYHIYDIKDLDSLKKTTMTAYFTKEVGRIKGEWEVPFTMDFKSNQKRIKTDQTIPWQSSKDLIIEDLILSNLAIHVTFRGDKFEAIPIGRLIFKDGSEKELYGGASFDKGLAVTIYPFETPIDISNVESIKFNDVEIQVKQ